MYICHNPSDAYTLEPSRAAAGDHSHEDGGLCSSSGRFQMTAATPVPPPPHPAPHEYTCQDTQGARTHIGAIQGCCRRTQSCSECGRYSSSGLVPMTTATSVPLLPHPYPLHPRLQMSPHPQPYPASISRDSQGEWKPEPSRAAAGDHSPTRKVGCAAALDGSSDSSRIRAPTPPPPNTLHPRPQMS
jgi:hypothetical protein